MKLNVKDLGQFKCVLKKNDFRILSECRNKKQILNE